MEVLRTLAGRLLGTLRAAGPVTILVFVIGCAGALLVIGTEFATIAEVNVPATGTCRELADSESREACHTTGFEQHGGAFLLLGGLALLMTLGVSRRASRPAAVALVAIGGVVLAFALARDVPKTNEDGLLGQSYADGKASAGSGLYTEIAGGALLILTGGIALMRGPAESPGPRRSPRSPAADEANGEAG